MKATKENLLFSAWLHSVGHPSERYRKPPAFFMLLAALVVSSFVANAQSEQWKAYLDIRKQSRADMTPCEKMELYARMASQSKYVPRTPKFKNSIMCKSIVRKQSALRAIKNVSERLYRRKTECITKPIP